MASKLRLHFLELPKLPAEADGKDALLLWLSLFRAETAEELEKLKKMEVPEMEQAINAYYTITASPEFREQERLREKARHDEAQALYHAEQIGLEKGLQQGLQKGKQEEQYTIARNLLNLGLPLEQIAAAAKVPVSEIEQLRRGLI